MVKSWEAGLYYPLGSTVEYQGQWYRIIQPHTSQSDWAPAVTPALWGKIDNPGHSSTPQTSYGASVHQAAPPTLPQPPRGVGYGPEYVHPHHGSPAPPALRDFPQSFNPQVAPQSPPPARGPPPVPPPHTRPQPQQPVSRELKVSHNSGNEDWISDARQRTDAFQRDGPQAPTTWVLTDGSSHVPGALIAGHRRGGKPLEIRRVHHNGNIDIRSEPPAGPHEILVGDIRGVSWIKVQGTFNPAVPGVHPVDGSISGKDLYIARAVHHGDLCLGSCGRSIDGVLCDGQLIQTYEVLCYN